MKRHRDENAYIKEPNSSNTYDKVKIILKSSVRKRQTS